MAKTKDISSTANPIPGAVAAQMKRGVPQHKAMASVGIQTKPSAPIKIGNE